MIKDYRVFWSEEDEEWVAHPTGEPSFSTLANSALAALYGLIMLEDTAGD